MNKEEIQNIIDNLVNSIFNTDWTKLLDYIKNIEKENQQLKKQKDDVVEYIKSLRIYGLRSGKMLISKILNKILRMLGEIDE